MPPVWGQAQKTAPVPKPEDAMISEGLRAYQAGRLTTAIYLLEQANVAAPDNPYARLFLGLFLYEKDPRSLRAVHLMESVLDRFPNNADLYLRLLDSSLSVGKNKEVPGLLDQMQKLMESNTRFAFNIIYTLVQHGKLEAARRELDKIAGRLENKPQEGPSSRQQSGEILFIRGLIAASSSDKSEAMAKFQAADRSEFPPQDSPQMKMLAEALFRFDEYALAAQAYQVYLSHFPQDLDARLQLAISYFSSTSFKRAQEEFQQVYEKAPYMPQINYYMGRVFLETKNHEEARRRFEAELKVNPASFPAMAELAYLDYTQGDNEKCLRWLEKTAALSPNYPEMHFVYGLLYNRQGKYDLAIKNLEKVVQYNPKHITAQFQLSIAYRRTGDEDKAREHTEIYNQLLEEHRAKTLGEDVRKK